MHLIFSSSFLLSFCLTFLRHFYLPSHVYWTAWHPQAMGHLLRIAHHFSLQFSFHITSLYSFFSFSFSSQTLMFSYSFTRCIVASRSPHYSWLWHHFCTEFVGYKQAFYYEWFLIQVFFSDWSQKVVIFQHAICLFLRFQNANQLKSRTNTMLT